MDKTKGSETQAVNGIETVDMVWPFDGPHSDDTIAQAALAVPRLVRYLNNATYPAGENIATGPALYRTVSPLSSAVHGLRQLLEQLRDTAQELAADGSMYDDRRDRPASATAVEAASHLDSALHALAPLMRSLARASSLACHLGHEEPVRGRSE